MKIRENVKTWKILCKDSWRVVKNSISISVVSGSPKFGMAWVALFKLAIIAAIIVAIIYIIGKSMLNDLLKKLITMGYLKEIKLSTGKITLVTEKIEDTKYNEKELKPPFLKFMIEYLKTTQTFEENENEIIFKESRNVENIDHNSTLHFQLKIDFISNFTITITRYTIINDIGKKINVDFGKEVYNEKNYDKFIERNMIYNSYDFEIKKNIAKTFVLFNLLEFYYSFQTKAINLKDNILEFKNANIVSLDVNEYDKFTISNIGDLETLKIFS